MSMHIRLLYRVFNKIYCRETFQFVNCKNTHTHMRLKNNLFQLLIILVCISCKDKRNESSRQPEKVPVADLEEIKSVGRIIAITDFNSTSYFIYRGQPMGFQYELLRELADHLGI